MTDNTNPVHQTPPTPYSTFSFSGVSSAHTSLTLDPTYSQLYPVNPEQVRLTPADEDRYFQNREAVRYSGLDSLATANDGDTGKEVVAQQYPYKEIVSQRQQDYYQPVGVADKPERGIYGPDPITEGLHNEDGNRRKRRIFDIFPLWICGCLIVVILLGLGLGIGLGFGLKTRYVFQNFQQCF
jgi:hypothetical protein